MSSIIQGAGFSLSPFTATRPRRMAPVVRAEAINPDSNKDEPSLTYIKLMTMIKTPHEDTLVYETADTESIIWQAASLSTLASSSNSIIPL
uniref:Uncharacterized protein n=1 Tax=Solanum lycopersicum TaxID=4081 RepID=K4CYI6_SOLLC